MKRLSAIWNPRVQTITRHILHQLGGGQRDYVDIGYKARACVDHDRRCAEIMRGRSLNTTKSTALTTVYLNNSKQ